MLNAATPRLSGRVAEALFGPALPAVLPDRVLDAIRKHEARSEVLICVLQIVAVSFFTALYVLAPKGFGSEALFEPVPVALAAYALFTGFRLRRALRGRLGNSLLGISVLIDVTVLMITIWSFHIQYGLPASAYLKAPTLLYVFIVIGLRALRFDPLWVVLAGLMSAAGWMLLLIYALNEARAAEMITRSFAEYVTSGKLLVGAEVDKIVAILVVTALLAVALERARRMLIHAVMEQTAAAELSRFFAPDIAASIVAAPQRLEAGTGAIRQAAIMFVDLRGFTTLASNLEPRRLVELLGEYHATVLPIVHRHNGSVITYLGDGIMITFGAVRPSPTSAADAVRAAEDLIDRLEIWARAKRLEGLPLMRAGIGVTFGPIVCGTIGTEGRLEYATIGDPVNRAARLQGLTKAEQVPVLVAANAWDRALAQGYEPRRPHDRRQCRLAGIEEPVEVMALAI